MVSYSSNSATGMAAKKSYPFEQSLEKLEKLVERMEEGDLSLEDSLKTFEEGIKLTRECQQALASAEQKVKLLIEENGQITESDFDEDEDQA
jgi:exodeoxyribonuclease VII small subunit